MTLEAVLTHLRDSGEPGPFLVGAFALDSRHLWVGRVEEVPHGVSHELVGAWAVVRPHAAGYVGLYGLVEVVTRLLGPGGCPWDQAQTHATLKKYLLEESYELMDAIDAADDDRMREELGDVLLQPLMHAQMRQRDGAWGADDVAQGIIDKLVRRHPHVFGDVDVADADEVLRNWDSIKQTEKGKADSILTGVPRAMPALLRAYDISKRAARAGFEWPTFEAVWEKFAEEERELREALASGDAAAIESELGDLLFTVVNLARWAKVEPEEALRRMLDRFTARFMEMERRSDRPLRDLSPEAWDDLWNAAKVSVAER
jgi:tetrapyrrole methylase family protein/MazG family protein